MAVVADIGCLRAGARNDIFERMQRAFERDGEVISVNEQMLDGWREEAEQAASAPQQTELL